MRGGEVYPRVCGGTTLLIGGTYVRRGLSPRVRGNLLGYTGSRREQRSIPACAGEPSRVYRFASRAEVYPRVCGGTF